MNFYPFHIGDYASATAHLSVLEDGIYRRLLDCYYTREAPIPAPLRQASRLVRAQSKDERQAVEDVLREFFIETPEGWRHSRCDEEIAAAREKGEESEARKANERERQKRHRERRAALFATLREHGQVPAFDTPTDTLQRMADAVASNGDNTPQSRDEDALSHGDRNAPVTRTDTQTQRLTNPNPNPKEKKAAARKTPLPAGFTASDQVRQWFAGKGYRESLQRHVENFVETARARGYTYVDWDAALRKAITDDWAKLRQQQPSLLGQQRASDPTLGYR